MTVQIESSKLIGSSILLSQSNVVEGRQMHKEGESAQRALQLRYYLLGEELMKFCMYNKNGKRTQGLVNLYLWSLTQGGTGEFS